jgi:MoxR-like ATPase
VHLLFADNRIAKLAAVLDSAQFTGNPTEGLGARNVYATRDQLVDELLKLARIKGPVLLKGPPACGKTSTLQLLYWTAQQVGTLYEM